MGQSDHDRFAYLPNVIGLVVGLYLVAVLQLILFLNQYRCRDYSSVKEDLNEEVNNTSEGAKLLRPPQSCARHFSSVTAAFFTPLTFESTYVAVPGVLWTSYLLCISRMARFVFFLVYPCIFVYVENKGDNWFYNTFWNVDIIVFFYLIASVASVIGLTRNRAACYEVTPATLHTIEWNYWERALALTVQMFFTVAAVNALLVTVFAFTFITTDTGFENVSYHVLNTAAFAFEMLLSSLIIRVEHLILSLSWFLLYAIYVWCMMVTHRLADWPYDALKTDNSSSLLLYGLLDIIMLTSCLIWYMASKVKVCVRGASIIPLLQLQTTARTNTPSSAFASVV